MKKKFLSFILIFFICVLTLILRVSGITTDWNQGIPDWHPDSARYFAQETCYIQHNYAPIAKGPLYTGNPYGNILILSWIWHGINQTAKFMGFETPIGMNPFTLSKIGRGFYIFLSLLVVLLLFFVSKIVFKSLFISFFSAFFFAVSPLAIGLTHTIKPELPLTFFLTLSAFFIVLLAQKRKISYYIFAGIFAGIATAVKYNGAIVLPFLFLIHAYKVFGEHKGDTLTRKIAFTLLSPSFLLSVVLWGAFFYAFEPVLWHNWKTGLKYIRGYLHVAALVGMPGRLSGHPLEILLYNIKSIPENLHMFFRCASFFVLTFSLLGLFFSDKKRVAYVFATFPVLILVVLFFTKSLFGEEYLLHPLPFIYVLAGLGCYALIDFFSENHCRKIVVASAVILLVMTYGFFIGFKEAQYASIGNIRYYANEWASENFKGQCINRMQYILLPRYNFCRHNASIFVVPSPKTYRRNYRLPKGSILLKTFQVEKDKPLLHHLRGHQIRFFAYRGENFIGQPRIPVIPIPCSHALSRNIVRFFDGVDFDPGYCKFSLIPRTQYSFKLVSSHKLENIKLLLKNSNVVNTVKVYDHSYKFLPFEKKIIPLPVPRCFPWISPYIYRFTIKSMNDMLLNINPLSEPNIIKKFVTYELDNNRMNFWPFGKEDFNRTFKSMFLYDFKYLENLLIKTIPLKPLTRIDATTDFYHKKNKTDFCLFYKEPVSLEKGEYFCHINAHLCLESKAKLIFKVITPAHILCKKVVTQDKLKKIPVIDGGTDKYLIKLPFHTESWSLTHILIEVEGKCKIKVDHISFETDVKSFLRRKIGNRVIDYFLKHKADFKPTLLEKLEPDQLNFRQGLSIATYLYKKHYFGKALLWYKAMFNKNPLSKSCASKIMKISHSKGNITEEKRFKNILNKLLSFKYGPWKFETGFFLNAISIPGKISKTNAIPFTLFLTLPNISGDQAVSLIFKNGNALFEKSISLLESKSYGKLNTIKGDIEIPENIQPGTYDVYFTFKIPRESYRYRALKRRKLSKIREIKICHMRIF